MLDYLVEELSFEYVIRIRGNVKVTDAKEESRRVPEWVDERGGCEGPVGR